MDIIAKIKIHMDKKRRGKIRYSQRIRTFIVMRIKKTSKVENFIKEECNKNQRFWNINNIMNSKKH